MTYVDMTDAEKIKTLNELVAAVKQLSDDFVAACTKTCPDGDARVKTV